MGAAAGGEEGGCEPSGTGGCTGLLPHHHSPGDRGAAPLGKRRGFADGLEVCNI